MTARKQVLSAVYSNPIYQSNLCPEIGPEIGRSTNWEAVKKCIEDLRQIAVDHIDTMTIVSPSLGKNMYLRHLKKRPVKTTWIATNWLEEQALTLEPEVMHMYISLEAGFKDFAFYGDDIIKNVTVTGRTIPEEVKKTINDYQNSSNPSESPDPTPTESGEHCRTN